MEDLSTLGVDPEALARVEEMVARYEERLGNQRAIIDHQQAKLAAVTTLCQELDAVRDSGVDLAERVLEAVHGG